MDRRDFLKLSGMTAGGAVFGKHYASSEAEMMAALKANHVTAKAKRVIFLSMSGGPSQFESFDYKPELAKFNGKTIPEKYTKGQQLAQLQGQKLVCLGPQFKFKHYGQSKQHICELFPQIGSVADDIAIIRSAHTEQINHDPAMTMLNTGTFLAGRPAMGSWINYAIGSESKSLPGFVVLESIRGRGPQPIYSRLWHSGFLPGVNQGVKFNSKGDAVYYVKNPKGVSGKNQIKVIDSINALNKLNSQGIDDPEIETRIKQYEMARRMQKSVPELMDVSKESDATLKMYGCKPGDGSFAYNCLLARRLAERGVRFIQLYHRGWDHHSGLRKYMPICAGATDRGTAALIKDLKTRGMLDETLIVWSGEFGRTPMAQSSKGNVGRDHHMLSFSFFMAGGGIKGGTTLGETDPLGYKPIKDTVNLRDLHATMLHLLGINHKKLTFKFQGLDNRLTGVEESHLLKKILA